MTTIEERWERLLAWLERENEVLLGLLGAGYTLDDAERAMVYSNTSATTERPISVQVMLSSLNTTAKARGGAESLLVG